MNPDDFVQSLSKGLDVIRAFGPDHKSMTLSDVARATGLTRASARRLLLTLVELDYAKSDGKHYSLRPRVLELGYAYLSSLTLPDIAQPHIEELVALTHESSSVAVLDRSDVVYVVRVPTKRIMTVAISVGTRFPAYATSLGRALLSGLSSSDLANYLETTALRKLTERTVVDPDKLRQIIETTRTDGYAITDQELEDGLRSIAVPIKDAKGATIAAINISAQAARVTTEELSSDFLPQLLRTAALIESDLKA